MRLNPHQPFGGPYRLAQLVNDDGEPSVRHPGDDLADLPEHVRAEIEAEWTPDLLAAWAAFIAPPLPSPADVIAERERRLALGFDHDFGDGRGVHHIGTTAQDMIGWREVTDLSNALIAAGKGSVTIQIVTDTGPVAVTAAEWQAILIASAAWRQPIWGASFALQAMDPVPDDFRDDQWWGA